MRLIDSFRLLEESLQFLDKEGPGDCDLLPKSLTLITIALN